MGGLADKLKAMAPERRLYSLQTLAAHLSAAGQAERLAEVLTTFDFLQAKVAVLDPQALIQDYEHTNEDSLRLIQSALQMSAHILRKDPEQLAGQLLGRLMKWETPRIETMLEQVRREKRTPWLRPLSQSLPSAGEALVRTLTDRTDWVTAVTMTPDGRHAVYAVDNTIIVADLESGTDQFTLEGHTALVTAVVVTQDGRRVVSASQDRTLKIWDLERRIEQFTLEGHTRDVTDVKVTPNGRGAVSASQDRTLKVWDLERRALLFTLKGHKDAINAVAVTPDGRLAVSAEGSEPYSNQNNLKIWDLERGTNQGTLTGHESWVYAVAVMPDGQRAISGSSDQTLKIWDLQREAELFTLAGNTSAIYAVALTPDGRHAISGSDYGTLKVWDLARQREVFALKAHAEQITSVAVSPDGGRAISSSRDGTLKVWDISVAIDANEADQGRAKHPEGHSDEVTALAVTPDGRHAISGSQDRTFKIWDLECGREVRTLIDSPDREEKEPGKRFLRGSGGNSRRRRGNWSKLIAVTPNGRHAVTAAISLADLSEHSLKVWDLETGRPLHTLKGHRQPVEAVAVTPDGRHIVSASSDYTLKIWNLKLGWKLRTLRGPNRSSRSSVAVTPDGRRIVSTLLYGLEVWDFRRRRLLHTLYPPPGSAFERSQITAMTVTPDGRCAISAALNNTLEVWDLENGQDIHTLKGHTSYVKQVRVTPDGRRAISAAGTTYTVHSLDNSLKVWDLEQGTELQALKGHQNNVEALAITPDGQYVVSASWDRTIKVWSLETGETIAGFTGESEILTCALAPDGRTIVAGEQSGRVHILRLENLRGGPAVVTACTRPLPRWRRLLPIWRARDPLLAFGCPFCRTWSEVPSSALGASLSCPQCDEPIELNPFTINADWRSLAAA